MENEYVWPPQLDFKLLGEWCEFCEERQSFDMYHFGTLLMEVYQMGITPEVDEFTKSFTKYFPKGIYDNLCRYAGHSRPKDDIVPWARREFAEMRSMLALELSERNSGQSRRSKTTKKRLKAAEVRETEALIKLIDRANLRITHDRDELSDIKCESALHSSLYSKRGDFVADLLGNDVRLSALQEVFYKLSCCNYFLAHSLMAPALKTPIDFSNYFEMHLRGGDYAFDESEIVLFIYRKDGVS